MTYQTLIEIVSEAENENEAIEIAGEFLRGNLESGVKMKCRTKPLKSRKLFQASIVLILVAICGGVVSIGCFKNTPHAFSRRDTISAFQPPLKTSGIADFSKSWKEEENKKVFEYVKE